MEFMLIKIIHGGGATEVMLKPAQTVTAALSAAGIRPTGRIFIGNERVCLDTNLRPNDIIRLT
jgi:hypothetical protein